MRILKFWMILIAMACMTITSNAQGSDGFFCSGSNYSGRDIDNGALSDGGGLTIEGMHNENPLVGNNSPLGSGLMIMTVAGASYVLVRRKRSLRKGMTLLLAATLLVGMTQCRKKAVTLNESDTVMMILESAGGRTVFVPDMGNGNSGFVWNEGVEYMSVSGDYSGYLGELSTQTEGGDASVNRKRFKGAIQTPDENDKELFIYYLGNGSHSMDVGTETTTIDFSNQTNGNEQTVTNYLIAIEKISKDNIVVVGDEYHVTLDLKVKTAIAYFSLNGFVDASDNNETVYLHGDDMYSAATIDFKKGTITGADKGNINIGTNGAKYVALIPSTETETTLRFDSNSKKGEMVFHNGIMEKRFYSAGLDNQEAQPLPVVVKSLPEDVLPGLFSVSPTKKVRFSKGNLKCTTTDNWETYSYGFMEHQYDIVEISNLDNSYNPISGNEITENYGNKNAISLFGWSTTGSQDIEHHENQNYYLPVSTKPSYNNNLEIFADQYGPTGNYDMSVRNHSDWGWCIDGENSLWRTPTYSEWEYLMGVRTPGNPTSYRKCSTVSGVENARYTKAKIGGAYGIVIFPDEYTLQGELNYINYKGSNASFSDNNVNMISLELWADMEEAGAVFIPAAGLRDDVYVMSVGEGGNYWLNTSVGDMSSRQFNFDGGFPTYQSSMRGDGYSVRLIYDAN